MIPLALSSPALASVVLLVAIGALLCVIVLICKLTRQKSPTTALLVENTFDNSPVCHILAARDNTILRLNYSAEVLCGYKEDEVRGQALTVLLDNATPFETSLGKSEANAKNETGFAPEEVHTFLKTKCGEKKPITLVASSMHDGNGNPIGSLLTVSDFSFITKTEEQLSKAERLGSLEIISASIAHDFNNLLTSITGNLALAHSAESHAEKDHCICMAEKATSVAAVLARQLLSLSSGSQVRKELCRLCEIIEEAAALSLRGTNIEYKISIPLDLAPAEVDRHKILEALMNVLINARQAMPAGGKVMIAARNGTILPDSAHSVERATFIEIEVKDEGGGIQQKDMEHIFDRFYTTKPNGTGLGLSIVRSIVEKHGGETRISSQPGIGTTVTILLPASSQEITIPESSNTDRRKLSGRILLMDDDDMLRSAVAAMLESMGLEVIQATNGAEAIEMYIDSRTRQKPILSLILDLTVADGRGGYEVLKRLREIDPDVKAIVSSGYQNHNMVMQYRDYGFSGAIAKPFCIEELGQVIRDVVFASPQP